MYEQIAANKRKTVLLIFGAIVLLGAVGYVLGLWYGNGIYGLVGAVALAVVLSLGSFFGGDRLVLASTRAREVTPAGATAPAQHRRGAVDRGRHPQAEGLPGPRAGAERVRDRPQPGALVGRGDRGAARDDEPGRARGRDRARALARRRPGHPGGDGRGDAGRRGGPDQRVLHAVVVVGRRSRPPRRRSERRRGRGDHLRGRARVAGAGADHRADRSAGRVAATASSSPTPRVRC